MAELPLSPMLARSLLASEEFQCSEEMSIIAAMAQIENIFVSSSKEKLASEREKRRFSVAEGDHLTLLNVFLAFDRYGRSSKWCRSRFLNYRGLCRAIELQNQLVRMLEKFKVLKIVIWQLA
jgi:ATP-dependent RNA helicase DDX35